MVAITGDEPSAAEEYDAEVKKEAEAVEAAKKEELKKEEKKLAEKKVDEAKAELKAAEKSLREEEEANEAEKAKKIAQEKALNEEITGNKYAGKRSKEFDAYMSETYQRDVSASSKAKEAAALAKGIRLPHPLDSVKPEDRDTI